MIPIKVQMSHPIFGGFTMELDGDLPNDHSNVLDRIKKELMEVARSHNMHAMVDTVQGLVLHIHNTTPDDNNTIYVCTHCL